MQHHIRSLCLSQLSAASLSGSMVQQDQGSQLHNQLVGISWACRGTAARFTSAQRETDTTAVAHSMLRCLPKAAFSHRLHADNCSDACMQLARAATSYAV